MSLLPIWKGIFRLKLGMNSSIARVFSGSNVANKGRNIVQFPKTE
jgi:hypothetical protein